MTEFLDLALDFLKDHKLVAGAIAILFIILLIRNFWFLVKLIVVLALGAVAVFLIYSFVGDAAKKKKELLQPDESSSVRPIRSYTAQWHPYVKVSDRFVTKDDPLGRPG